MNELDPTKRPIPYTSSSRFHVVPPPVAIRGARLWTFAVRASPIALQSLIDRTLTGPSGIAFRPLGPWIWLVFADLPDIRATNPHGASTGSIREREAAIWVPVGRRDDRGRVVQASWFLPYMFVDSGIALSAGREGLGLPKELASVRLDPEAGCFSADADTVLVHRPGAQVESVRLISVTPAEHPPKTSWREVLRTSPTDLLALWRSMRSGGMPLTTLRQLPSADDPRRAAYVDLAEHDIRVDRRASTVLLPPSRVRFADPDLHPLVRDLGVVPGAVSPFAARLELDFSLGTGRTLWSSAPAPRPVPSPRKRLAVLGGGLGSLSTLFELTSRPDWHRHWEITVYQPGWRLGGKAASSRNACHGNRSEEHGLHVWFGFYRNAFRLVREVYTALDRPDGHPLQRPEQAFVSQSRVHFHDTHRGRPCTWIVDYPSQPGFPGDPSLHEGALTAIPSPATLLRRGMKILVGMLRGEPVMRHRIDGADVPPLPWKSLVVGLLRRGRLPRALRRLEKTDADESGGILATRLLEVRRSLRTALGPLEDLHPDVLHLWIVAESAVSMGLGIARDGLRTRGFDAIDGEDFRAWLARHGAPPEVLESAPLKALYDASFAYAQGDPAQPDLAAGSALLTVLRMVLTYEGAILWKTTVGMGEAIIAPLYEALAARGVRFEFFHRVDRLELSADASRVGAVHLTRQALPTQDTYAPLVDIGGVRCWPSQPKLEDLVDGDALAGLDPSWLESGADGGPSIGTVTLQAGQDYDALLLGIGLGALPRTCAELAAARPAWRAMLEGLSAVRTSATQVWASQPAGTVEAIDNLPSAELPSWIDMAPVLANERRTDLTCSRLLYGAGVLRGDVPIDETTGEAGTQADRTWSTHSHALAPTSPEILDRYTRANVHGSELYERAATGTAHLRLAADDSGFEDLFLTGAWTRTGFHIGSVEAAVMSGRLAASAIDGVDRQVVGAGLAP